jgi:hypothetical protein
MCPRLLGSVLGSPAASVATRMWGGASYCTAHASCSWQDLVSTHPHPVALYMLSSFLNVSINKTPAAMCALQQAQPQPEAPRMPCHGGAVIVALGSQCKSGTSDLCSWDVVSDNYRAPKSGLRLEHVSAACIQATYAASELRFNANRFQKAILKCSSSKSVLEPVVHLLRSDRGRSGPL